MNHMYGTTLMKQIAIAATLAAFTFGCATTNEKNAESTEYNNQKVTVKLNMLIGTTEMYLTQLQSTLRGSKLETKPIIHKQGYSVQRYILSNNERNIKNEINSKFSEICGWHKGVYSASWCKSDTNQPIFRADAVEYFEELNTNEGKPLTFSTLIEITRPNSINDPENSFVENYISDAEFNNKLQKIVYTTKLIERQTELRKKNMNLLLCTKFDESDAPLSYGWMVSAHSYEGIQLIELGDTTVDPVVSAGRAVLHRNVMDYQPCRAQDVLKYTARSWTERGRANRMFEDDVINVAFNTIDFILESGAYTEYKLSEKQ